MLAIGLMISKTVSGSNLGPTEQSTRDSTRMEKNMEKVYSCGETIVATMEISAKITSMVKANIAGKMEEYTKANGVITKWKELEFSHGLMVENTKVSTRMIRNKDTVSSHLRMVECIKDSG